MPRIHGVGSGTHIARTASPSAPVTTKSALAISLLVVAKLSSVEATTSALVLGPPVCPALPHSVTVCSTKPPMLFFKFSQFEIDDYLRHADSRLDWSRFSPHEKAALEVKGRTRAHVEQRAELWSAAFEDYAQQLTSVVHPVESALLHHQMRRALENKRDSIRYSKEEDTLTLKNQELLLCELDACKAAADVSEPMQKVQWLQRGI